MSSVIKRDKFDFYGNTMTVQLVQNDHDDTYKLSILVLSSYIPKNSL